MAHCLIIGPEVRKYICFLSQFVSYHKQGKCIGDCSP